MSKAVHAEFDAALDAELFRVGPEAFKVAPVVKAFRDRGVASEATLFRWAQKYRASGRPGQVFEEAIKAADDLARRDPDAVNRNIGGKAKAVAEILPRVPRVDAIASAGGTVAVIDEIRECIELARELVQQARDPDTGKVRLTKMALAASEHLRRSLETAVRLAEAMRDVSRVDQFHEAVLEEIGKVSPEVAARLCERLHGLTLRWNAGL